MKRVALVAEQVAEFYRQKRLDDFDRRMRAIGERLDRLRLEHELDYLKRRARQVAAELGFAGTSSRTASWF